MSRTVNGEWLFDDPAKEVLRRQLWQAADFCGVKLITYHVSSNHFHILVRVPKKAALADAELLRRFRVLHPHPTRSQAARLDVIQHWLATDAPEGEAWRRRVIKLMGDVSAFMKILKQRFSIWFNRSRNRFGTLWAERFKSVLVEGSEGILRTMAAYIDLNCVRAGIVRDPKDYRFCGYAEAVAGNELIRESLRWVCGHATWEDNQSAYRQILFGAGSAPRRNSGGIQREDFARVISKGGRLDLSEVLRCRVRYFTDGAVLGSRAFVQDQLAIYQARTGRRRGIEPKLLPSITDWGNLAVLRGVRGLALG
jgi:REP element-mobilizing transposase RayT